MLEVPPNSPAGARYLATALHAFAREEHIGRRRRRLLEPNQATWQRFRGRLGPRDLVELLLVDAAVDQPEPFDVERVFGDRSPVASVSEALIGDWLTELPKMSLEAADRDYLEEQQARRLVIRHVRRQRPSAQAPNDCRPASGALLRGTGLLVALHRRRLSIPCRGEARVEEET